MKTCQTHNYNPPSRCPNCKIRKKHARRASAKKGWQTREITKAAKTENEKQKKKEKLARHGWSS